MQPSNSLSGEEDCVSSSRVTCRLVHALQILLGDVLCGAIVPELLLLLKMQGL